MGWNGRRVRGTAWRWPSGYGYQRWSVGGILPAIFLSQAYWYSGYAALGFEAPPWGYQWVRYGNDLLLVQISTGQVVDAEYGVFY
jgi:Ni/Co efflux regulator RcnB